MTISESIEVLFDEGIAGITIGKPPKGAGTPEWFVKAEQGITTGPTGNQIITGHQCTGGTISECLNRLQLQVEAIAKMNKGKSPILTPGGRRE